jgi:hypothetical protein
VLTFGLLAERDAIERLQDIALTDDDPAVVAAARASLERIAQDVPRSPRGWLEVEYPDTFVAGLPLSIKVTFGSKAEVRRARLVLQLPPAFQVLDPKQPPIWQGSVEAGRTYEHAFDVVATKDVRAGSRVHLALDYPDPLDLETLHDRMRVAIENGKGHFEPLPAEITRKP